MQAEVSVRRLEELFVPPSLVHINGTADFSYTIAYHQFNGYFPVHVVMFPALSELH